MTLLSSRLTIVLQYDVEAKDPYTAVRLWSNPGTEYCVDKHVYQKYGIYMTADFLHKFIFLIVHVNNRKIIFDVVADVRRSVWYKCRLIKNKILILNETFTSL